MSPIRFTIDGRPIDARAGETIMAAADRHGIEIPRLCSGLNAYRRDDGNCRLCVVEIEGERVLAPSCRRHPRAGMTVGNETERVGRARRAIMEMLIADHPARDRDTHFWRMADVLGVSASRYPRTRKKIEPDISNRAIAVNLAACIHCTACLRACREDQVNDVIGMAGRGARSTIVFDQADPLGGSSCVTCGECVQACPTGALAAKGAPADQCREVSSLCPYCGVGCQVTFKVRDGRLVAADGRDGPANQGRLCVKGRYGFDYIYHPHRLTVPLIRRDDAPKNPTVALDPANPFTHFRAASWDEALDRAAGGLAAIRDAHGGDALAGFGSAKGSNEEAYLFQKLIRAGFHTNNVDHCTRLCHASSVAALMEGIGSGAVTAPFTDALTADAIIVIGANPTVNHPVAATFFKNAVQRGAQLIVMDPRGQALSRHATHMLQFKGGTDVALLNALMHVIVDEGLYDQAYIDRFTSGFADLKRHLAGFAPEPMAEICGIDAERLRAVARAFAGAERAMIFWGMGVSQHSHGTDNARCLIALALMCGQVGRPGTGLHPLRGQNNVQGASDAGLIPMFYPDYKSVEDDDVRTRFEDLWQTGLDPKRGMTVVEIINAANAGTIKGMYILGENPAMSDPDLNHARAGLAALDHLVVQDIFLTETAWHADVVLPASAFAEKTGTFTNTNRQVQLGRQAVDPPGQARQDWRIIQDLARRLGLDWVYAHPRDVFGEMRRCLAGFAGIDWDRLEAEDAVTYPAPAIDQPGLDVIFGDGFPTADGKARFVPAHVLPPDEVPDADFPMILSTGRLLEHWHTGAMTRRAGVLNGLEPEAIALLAPEDLRRLNIHAGGTIRVSTRRGAITLIARGDGKIAPGSLYIPFCFVEGPANMLTNPALDPVGKIPEFKFCAARVDPAFGLLQMGI